MTPPNEKKNNIHIGNILTGWWSWAIEFSTFRQKQCKQVAPCRRSVFVVSLAVVTRWLSDKAQNCLPVRRSWARFVCYILSENYKQDDFPFQKSLTFTAYRRHFGGARNTVWRARKDPLKIGILYLLSFIAPSVYRRRFLSRRYLFKQFGL